MRTRREPLLAELHAHTTWSDGELSVRELVDLVGGLGFDVLCVTDHVVRGDDPWLDERQGREWGVTADEYAAYVAELACEGERARTLRVATHAALVTRRCAARARPPLRAVQPHTALRLGRRGRAPRRCRR